MSIKWISPLIKPTNEQNIIVKIYDDERNTTSYREAKYSFQFSDWDFCSCHADGEVIGWYDDLLKEEESPKLRSLRISLKDGSL